VNQFARLDYILCDVELFVLLIYRIDTPSYLCFRTMMSEDANIIIILLKINIYILLKNKYNYRKL